MLRGFLTLGLIMIGAHIGTGAAEAAPAADQARVTERSGAPVREDSAADAPVMLVGECNETFLVVASNGPWREVFRVVGLPDEETEDEDDDIFGWILAEHATIGPDPGPVDCSAPPPFAAGRQVQSASDRGCLTLRSAPSLSADESECYPDGTRYEVVSGPTGDGGEWFEVRPLGIGPNGWARGRDLIAAP